MATTLRSALAQFVNELCDCGDMDGCVETAYRVRMEDLLAPSDRDRGPLSEHRICNADYGRVACYCSAFDWMTLDQYGEHIEAVASGRTP